MPVTFGDKTKNIFLNAVEAHKLHVEFVAGGKIGIGQQVKLSDTETVVAASANELAANIIGVSIHDAESGELVTVAVKAYTTVIGVSSGAINPGPVETAAYDTTLGRPAFVAAASPDPGVTIDNTCGWSIDKAEGSGELIRVMLV